MTKPDTGLLRTGTEIAINSAKCLLCGDTLISTHRHDFNSCKCGNLSVDGGKDYIRRCYGAGPKTVEELSKAVEDDKK